MRLNLVHMIAPIMIAAVFLRSCNDFGWADQKTYKDPKYDYPAIKDDRSTISDILMSTIGPSRITDGIVSILTAYTENSDSEWIAVLVLNEGNASYDFSIIPKGTNNTALSYSWNFSNGFVEKKLPEMCKNSVPTVEELKTQTGHINLNVEVSHPSELYAMQVNRTVVQSFFGRDRVGLIDLSSTKWLQNCV